MEGRFGGGQTGRALHNVLDYGAVNDGQTQCAEAIARTIEACACAGGGTVCFPGGAYLTGSIHLRSNITLFIDAGARLLYSPDPHDSPLVESRIGGTRGYVHSPLIYGNDLENIAVVGRGTIDGQGGKGWWRRSRKKKVEERKVYDSWGGLRDRAEAGEAPAKEEFAEAAQYLRPSLVHPYNCKNVLIEGVTLMNSPHWTIHPAFCEDVTIRNIIVESPDDSPNTDGIAVDSCRNVRISDCRISTGDDCIVLKSGRDADGRRVGRPTENVAIVNCTLLRGHGGVVIGSEMSGGVRNVVASNIVCKGTVRGIRIKSERGRGGVVENIRYSNWVIENAREAINITNFYHETPEEPVSERTPVFRQIAASHVTVANCREAAHIRGLPESPIEGLRFSDVAAITGAGFKCVNVAGLDLRNIQVDAAGGPALDLAHCRDVAIEGFKTRQPHEDAPAISLNEVERAFIHGCVAAPGANVFLRLSGEKTREIVLGDNNLSAARQAVDEAPRS